MPVGHWIHVVGTAALTWLPLVFFGLICYLLWRTVQMMPRVKPTQLRPDSSASVSWGDVAGAEEAKAELLEVVDFLRHPKRFERLGARVPKGILLYGPPGTGKTLLAKAVANESGAAFYSQSASAFVEMFAGLGALRIRRLFKEARKHSPSIVFIDELDAVGAARTGHGFNREQDQTLNQLLVELDGFGVADQVVVMGASNRLQDLDPALLRPGRFDRQMLVAPPDLAGREEILYVHTRGKPLAGDVDLALIARQTAGLTGADLANVCNEAAIFAGRQHLQYIRHVDFENAMERVVAGLQQRRVVTEKEKRILAYHEGGHALMSHLMGDALPDQEQARLTDEAYDEAIRLLGKHRAALDRVAAALLEKETLVREEIDSLVGGAEPEHRELVPEQGVEAAAVRVGESRVELLASLGEDTPVGKFLAKRGPGMHHVAYEVDDLRATLAHLADTGAELIDDEPRQGLFGLEVAFVHPDAVHGVLSEVVANG